MPKWWTKPVSAALRKTGPDVTAIILAAGSEAGRNIAGQLLKKPATDRYVTASWGKAFAAGKGGFERHIQLSQANPLAAALRLKKELWRYWTRQTLLIWEPSAKRGHFWAAAAFSPLRLAIVRGDGERLPWRWLHPIAGRRFLDGDSIADLQRPTALGFLRGISAWTRATLQLIPWRFARLRSRPNRLAGFEPSTEAFTFLCLQPEDLRDRIDDEAKAARAEEILVTLEPRLPDRDEINRLRKRLDDPSVWLVAGRANATWRLAADPQPCHENEVESFCLAAPSSTFLFRRKDFLELGGLAAHETNMPGRGLCALSLLGWLRGRKTVYAGDPELPLSQAETPETPNLVAQLLPESIDHAPTAIRALRAVGGRPDFTRAYLRACRLARPPRLASTPTPDHLPLIEAGIRILEGGARRDLAAVAVVTGILGRQTPPERMRNLLARLALLGKTRNVYLFAHIEPDGESITASLREISSGIVVFEPPRWEAPGLFRGLPAGAGRIRVRALASYIAALAAPARFTAVQAETRVAGLAVARAETANVKKLLCDSEGWAADLAAPAAGESSAGRKLLRETAAGLDLILCAAPLEKEWTAARATSANLDPVAGESAQAWAERCERFYKK